MQVHRHRPDIRKTAPIRRPEMPEPRTPAAVKPFAWRRAGLWRLPAGPDNYSWTLGLTDNPHRGQELLGGWIIPIGLAAGLLLGWLTWRFGIFSVRRMRRAARRRQA